MNSKLIFNCLIFSKIGIWINSGFAIWTIFLSIFEKRRNTLWFFFEMCFHFQNVKGFASVVFPFSEKYNFKQKSVHSLQISLLMRLWTNNEICTKLLNLFQLSEIHNLLYEENTLWDLVTFTIFQSYLDLDLLWHFIVLQVKKLLFFCSLVVEESK